MKSLKPIDAIKPDERVFRLKRQYGIIYGAITGLAFAGGMWGLDGYLLSQSHAFFPWLKLIIGAVLSTLTGVIFGYLAIRIERGIYSLLLWLAASGVFAWLTISVPLQFAPFFSRLLEPQLNGLLTYGLISEFMVRMGVAFAWIIIFTVITGILQLPLADTSVFSTSIFGKVIPFVVCILIMGIAGSIADELNNAPLRDAITSMDHTIQFIVDNKGKEISPQDSRELHVASMRLVQDSVTAQRQLIIMSYDQFFEQVHVLIQFQKQWADCVILYNQPNICKPISPLIK